MSNFRLVCIIICLLMRLNVQLNSVLLGFVSGSLPISNQNNNIYVFISMLTLVVAFDNDTTHFYCFIIYVNVYYLVFE